MIRNAFLAAGPTGTVARQAAQNESHPFTAHLALSRPAAPAKEPSPAALHLASPLIASSRTFPGALGDADGDGRLTPVDIRAFIEDGGAFKSPASLAASLVATGASRFIFGENHDAPHPELIVATIREIALRRGQAPVVFHESFGGPFQDLVDALHGGRLSERDFAQRYLSLTDALSGGAQTEYARHVYVPQLLAYHRAGARIVLLDDLEPASNRDASWEKRYAADQARNPHDHSIFVVGGVHSQKSPSITDDDFPENDFERPIGVRIAERYGARATLNIYVANSPDDAMAEFYRPSFSSWDAILAMPRDTTGRGGGQPVLPADADGVPLLSPEALGAQWHDATPQMKALPKGAASGGGRKALNSNA